MDLLCVGKAFDLPVTSQPIEPSVMLLLVFFNVLAQERGMTVSPHLLDKKDAQGV